LKPKAILIVGILEAQVEKLKPDIKKNVLRNILWVFLEMISFIYAAKISNTSD